MRFVLLIAVILNAIMMGNAVSDQNWNEFWVWFSMWAVCVLVLLGTRER